jgi:hypothetical protein
MLTYPTLMMIALMKQIVNVALVSHLLALVIVFVLPFLKLVRRIYLGPLRFVESPNQRILFNLHISFCPSNEISCNLCIMSGTNVINCSKDYFTCWSKGKYIIDSSVSMITIVVFLLLIHIARTLNRNCNTINKTNTIMNCRLSMI